MRSCGLSGGRKSPHSCAVVYMWPECEYGPRDLQIALQKPVRRRGTALICSYYDADPSIAEQRASSALTLVRRDLHIGRRHAHTAPFIDTCADMLLMTAQGRASVALWH